MDWHRRLYIPNDLVEPDKKSLYNPAEKKTPSAPTLLPLQHVGVLPFAMGMIKVVVDGGGTELLKSQAEKNQMRC